ncbi:MAG: DJ-1/PfpI family protein [Victivallales bacterium]|nr:DJ-1/PfpI family protein [Victivallales bacterium]
MSEKTVFFILLNKYADWEAAPLASIINSMSGWRVKTVSPHKVPIHSIGGFTVISDMDITQAMSEDCAGVVLVGGMSWRLPEANAVEPLVRSALEKHIPIGAICDATTYIAKLGILNAVSHTGNTLSDLKTIGVEHYSGEARYRDEQAVRDGGIVTANGFAAIDFSREMIIALDLMSEQDAARWYRLEKLGFYEAQAEAFWLIEKLSSQ